MRKWHIMARTDTPRATVSRPRFRRHRGAASIGVVVGVVLAVVAPSIAHADGPTTFTNTATIDIPAVGAADQIGPANPYPSTITVSGMTGAVTAVQVVFHGLTHSTLNDVDALVVAPSGQNLVVLSDIGDPATLAFASNATLTFDDAATGSVPSGNVPTGTYRPTNNGAADSFPPPAPAPSAQTTLADAFTGINPNGTWQLFIVDDSTGDVGSMAGGWSLVITTDLATAPTTTVMSTSGSPSATGNPVTFTATVTASGTPVTSGTVAFTADGMPLATVAVNASGVAQLSTSSLAEGTHAIVGTYSGSPGFLTSNGSVAQRVDNTTVVTGTTFCNAGPLTVPSNGAAVPYPSNITVSGLTAPVSKVTATLNGVSHAVPVDLDVMLSSPVPTTNILLMSDVGGTAPVSGLTITLDDAAAASVPTPLTSGTFRPTNDDSGGVDAAFPAPAPIISSATTLATFNGASGNGVWSLWVVDDATGDSGAISGGWCLTFTTVSPTTTTLVSSMNPSLVGGAVTFTATVASGGAPVTTGTIAFSDGATPLGGTVAVDATGTATFTTSALTAGTHSITASYSGTPAYATSTDTLDQVVNEAGVADAGGPYSVAEGDSLTLDGSGSTPGLTYEWDLNADGDFTDATGMTPTLTWTQLQALGIDDGPSTHTIAVRTTRGAQQATDTATLAVTNTAPSTVATGTLTATAGALFAIKVGADDPSSADMAALFAYTVDWGDGSPILRINGPADSLVTHTYSAPGTYSASFTSTDKDGGTSAPLTVQVRAAAATPPTPTPPSQPSQGTTLPATGADSSGAALTAGLLILLGVLTVAAAGRRRRPGTRPGI